MPAEINSDILIFDQNLLDQREYWIRKLSCEREDSQLRPDHPRPVNFVSHTSSFSFDINGDLYQKLKKLTGDGPFLMYTVLLVTLKITLHKYNGSTSIVVGSPSLKETDDVLPTRNALAIVDEVTGLLSFRELLLNVRRTLLEAYDRQHYSYARVLRDLGIESLPNRCPLFDITVLLSEIHNPPAETKNDLTISFDRESERLRGCVEFSPELYERDTIESFCGHWLNLLGNALAASDEKISELEITSPGEREQLLFAWNRTESSTRTDKCFHQLFEEQAKKTPAAIALVDNKMRITYSDLNVRANRLAHHLRRLGVGPDVLVGICVERSIEMVVALLGILKAGGAYVPLDPHYPQARLAFILADAGIKVLVTENSLNELLPAHEARLVRLDIDGELIAGESDESIDSHVMMSNLAYVIYTSGSTGRPKGVLVEHRGLSNLAEAQRLVFKVEAGQRALQFSSLSFDASIFEIVMALRSGATLYLGDLNSLLPGPGLSRYLHDHAITNVTLPPSVLSALAVEPLPDLRTITVAGEACSVELINRWAEGRRFFNAYGPTETTVWATTARCTVESQSATIGHPISNTTTYLLDEYLRPVPVGVQGELHIAGAGIARGYLNSPELTAERFVPLPFGKEMGVRMYRTGDAARYRSDGQIEFLGRMDQQVKVRGFRIEPGEIEARLQQHPKVRDSVVIVREDVPGNKRIVAYVVPHSGASLTAGELRDQLKMQVPDYMMPAAFVMLDALPSMPNGKVDRLALPAPEVFRNEPATAAPLTTVEQMLSEIWLGTLSLEAVGLHDNFFEIGGHSLLATRTMARICDVFKVELPLQCLFETPTIAALAARIEAARNDGPAVESLPSISPRANGSQIPLSFAQERLWFLYNLEPSNPSYNVAAALQLVGSLNPPALMKSLNEIVRRHEVLRTSFAEVDGYAVQVVAAAADSMLSVIDLREMTVSEGENEAVRLAELDARSPFNLDLGPLLRFSLLRLADDVHVLLLNVHHIVFDGWSLGVFINELGALYHTFSMGEPSMLPELKIQYGDYAIWQREWLGEAVLGKQLAYWKRQLGEAPSTWELPTDHPRPLVQTYGGIREPFRLPASLVASLNDLGRREGATLFMTLLTAFKAVLARSTAEDDIIIGTDVANRNRADTDDLVGFFVNMLTLRTDWSGDPTFREALARVREVTLSAYQHQDFPFGALIKELQKGRDPSRSPLFQVVFALQNTPLEDLHLSGLNILPIAVDSGTVQFDLIVSLIEDPDGLRGVVAYNTSLFDAETITKLLEHFRIMLEAFVDNPEQRLSNVRWLSDEQTGGCLLEDFPEADLSRKDFENLMAGISDQP